MEWKTDGELKWKEIRATLGYIANSRLVCVIGDSNSKNETSTALTKQTAFITDKTRQVKGLFGIKPA